MIISPSLRTVFVHIPKNAGSTIETLFDPWLDPRTDLHVSKASSLPSNFAATGVNSDNRVGKHSSTDQILAAMGPGKMDRYFSFAFIRNPFARCFSAYRYMQERAEKDIRDGTLSQTGEGADRQIFLHRSFDDICADLPNLSFVFQLFLPQFFWLPTETDLSFLGRVENMDEDLAVIFDLLDLPSSGLDFIPRRNSKTGPNEWRAMPGACVDAIRVFYAEDFTRFDYSTDPLGNERAPRQTPAMPPDWNSKFASASFGPETDGKLRLDTGKFAASAIKTGPL